jgi:hypothetical protein
LFEDEVKEKIREEGKRSRISEGFGGVGRAIAALVLTGDPCREGKIRGLGAERFVAVPAVDVERKASPSFVEAFPAGTYREGESLQGLGKEVA